MFLNTAPGRRDDISHQISRYLTLDADGTTIDLALYTTRHDFCLYYAICMSLDDGGKEEGMTR